MTGPRAAPRDPAETNVSAPRLRRNIGLPLLTFYGIGTILGAGIYVLIGEVAAVAGPAAPSAFVLAAVIAAMTALSFAELSGRIPKSAGEAAYAYAAFELRALSTAVGWAVIFVGVVSAATMVRGFVGYLEVFVALPPAIVILVAVAALFGLAVWGIGESLVAAAAVTVLEVGGLLFVCIVAGDSLGRLPAEWTTLLPRPNAASLLGVTSGAFLAFYAYIGFEDMVNVAEEVVDPTRKLPLAIVLALIVSTAIYILVATVATLAIPNEELSASGAPLAAVVESRGLPPEIIAFISLFAVMNGALIQIIMASRVLYGLAENGLAWRGFGRVNPRTQTPVIGSAVVAAALALLAIFFSLGGLARATSFVALGVFAVVNASLWRIKLKGTAVPAFEVPIAVPAAGFMLCVGMIIYQGTVRS